MKNFTIRDKINKSSDYTHRVLESLIADAIIEMAYRNRINKDILRRMSLVYLSLFEQENYLEYDELSLPEKNIICRIISKGIASIYVDNEYLNKSNSKYKLIIIDDMIDFLCLLTDFNKSTIKRLVRRDIMEMGFYLEGKTILD